MGRPPGREAYPSGGPALFFPGVGRVRHAGIDRADFRALGRAKMADALNTLVRIDDVSCFTLADGLHRAFRLAGPAADALIGDFISHSIYLLNLSRRDVGQRVSASKI